MKTLAFIASMLMIGTGSFAQNFLLLENGTSCGLMVQLYERDPNTGCGYAGYQNYYVGPGQSVPAQATASAVSEFVYAEIVNWPAPPYCFGVALDTDGFPNCMSCPGFGAPSAATVTTGGCGGCPNTINMLWTAYCGSGPGHIHFY